MRILFIPCSRIGDSVLTTSVLGEIEHRYPQAKVTIAADPRSADLFSEFPLLDQLIVFSKQRYSKHWYDLWRRVVRKRWDWVIDFRASPLPYGLWTRRRSVWRSRPGDLRHKVEQVCSLVGFEISKPTLWFSTECIEKVQKLFEVDKCYLALAPSAAWVGKQWPLDSWLKLIRLFLQKYTEARVAICAGPEDNDRLKLVFKGLPEDRVRFLVGSGLNLLETAACIKCSQAFIGNDSGLMHVSAAVRTPTIALFGPSREQIYGPWQESGVKRNIVVRTPLSYDELLETPNFSLSSQNCYMRDLSVDTVWNVLQEVWNRQTAKQYPGSEIQT